jgi:zinc protease
LAYLLAGEKNSRLTQTLVYEKELASEVYAYQDGKRIAGDFWVVATARPSQALPELQRIIETELKRIAAEGPTEREMEQAHNATEASFLRRLETVSRKADALNAYYVRLGQPDSFEEHLRRYRAVTAADVQRVAKQYLQAARVVLSVVPQGHPELGAKMEEVTP